MYKISEFADLLGVSPDTLRHYEKLGIIHPIKESHSSYRLFDDLDCRNILRSRWFRSLDLSMKETAELTNLGSLEKVTESLAKNRIELTAEINRLQGLVDKTDETLEICGRLKYSLNQTSWKTMPAFLRISQTHQNTLISSPHINQTVRAWMNCLPHTFFSCKMSGYEPYSAKTPEYNFGLAITSEDLDQLELPVPADAESIPASEAVEILIRLKEGDALSNGVLDRMENLAEIKNYRSTGTVYGRILFAEKSQDGMYNYTQLLMPVESID